MPSWKLKALAQGALSVLPRPHEWNRLFQVYLTRSLEFTPQAFEGKLLQCRRHIEHYLAVSGDRQALPSALEIGTGWRPIVPVGLALAGFQKVWTLDIVPLLKPEAVGEVLRMYVNYARSGRLGEFLPGVRHERLQALEKALAISQPSAARMLESVSITAAITDARRTGLAPASVGLIVSNNTLEHIPGDVLRPMFAELARIGQPGAVMSHFIDVSDHYARSDPSITRFNFLQYPDRRWRWFNNRLQYQNRLRLSDYVPIHGQYAFEIISSETTKGRNEDLSGIVLAPEFRSYSAEDLLVLSGWIVSVRSDDLQEVGQGALTR